MEKILHFIHKRFYVLMLVSLLVSLLLTRILSPSSLSIVYAISLSFKEIILFLMPALIFCCSYQCMYKLKHSGLYFIVCILGVIAFSNFIASWMGFSVAKGFQHQLTIIQPVSDIVPLQANWVWSLPKLLSNDVALFLGILIGIFAHKVIPQSALRLSETCKKISHVLMNYILLPVLPVFIAGFIIKMVYDGTVSTILQQYAVLAGVIFATYAGYMFLGYLVVAKGNIKTALKYIKNVLPASWVGFTCMSSLAALPISLQAAEKNTRHKDLIGGVLPMGTNIHLLGDSLGIPILATSIILLFGGVMPDPVQYLHFSVFLVFAKFSAAAVPSGALFVILPILENVLGFNSEMVAQITLLYMLLDPLVSAANVMGNGLFAIVMDKLFILFKKNPKLVPLNEVWER